jgi:alkylated DNA repair dioxygenase AlkB
MLVLYCACEGPRTDTEPLRLKIRKDVLHLCVCRYLCTRFNCVFVSFFCAPYSSIGSIHERIPQPPRVIHERAQMAFATPSGCGIAALLGAVQERRPFEGSIDSRGSRVLWLPGWARAEKTAEWWEALSPAADSTASPLDPTVSPPRKGLHWQRREIVVWGKRHSEPRDTCCVGACTLRYSSLAMDPVQWEDAPDALQAIRDAVELAVFSPATPLLEKSAEAAEGAACGGGGGRAAHFDTVLCNFYCGGTDGVSWHCDKDSSSSEGTEIASLSLGGTRAFLIKEKKSSVGADVGRSETPSHRLTLRDGDLLVMMGSMQKHWLHCVPKCATAQPRMNLTFRQLRARVDEARPSASGPGEEAAKLAETSTSNKRRRITPAR